MAGYSNTPLYKKLGIKEDTQVRVVDLPHGYSRYQDIFSELPFELNIPESKIEDSIDLVHIFVTDYGKLKEYIRKYKKLIKKNGMIWISWPKSTSNIQSMLNENLIRDLALQEGLVDVKVCAVDENWSGLKLIYRLKDR